MKKESIREFLKRTGRALHEHIHGTPQEQNNRQQAVDRARVQKKREQQLTVEDTTLKAISMRHSQLSAAIRDWVRDDFFRQQDYLQRSWEQTSRLGFPVLNEDDPALSSLLTRIHNERKWIDLQFEIAGKYTLALNELLQVVPFDAQHYDLDYSWQSKVEKTPDIRECIHQPVLVAMPPLLYGSEVIVKGSAFLLPSHFLNNR